MGAELRQHYIEDEGLLTSSWKPGTIQVRSTNSARTIETALEIVSGMYDVSEFRPLRVELHDVNHETMYPLTSCGVVAEAVKEHRMADIHKEIKKRYAALFDESKFDSEDHYSFWVKRSIPAACNTLESIMNHGFPLPAGITPELVKSTCDLSGMDYTAFYKSPRISKFAIGRFLGEVLSIMNNKVEYENTARSSLAPLTSLTYPPKFVLMSGHDNTIAPILQSLKLTKDVHPPMGSGLAFELYEDPVHSDDKSAYPSNFYVSILYNFHRIRIPGCGNEYFCPYDSFLKLVSEQVPLDYKKDCDLVQTL